MYVHIGSNILVTLSEMIAVIARKGTADKSKTNKAFLERVMKEGEVIDISKTERENAKSMVLVNNNRVYISPISPHTLSKRVKNMGSRKD